MGVERPAVTDSVTYTVQLYRTGGAGHGYFRLPARRRVEPEHRRLRLVGALAAADHRSGGTAFLSQPRVSVPQLVVRDAAPVAHLERGGGLKNTDPKRCRVNS